MASNVSVSVPIWLTLMRMEFATPFSMPSLRMAGFVTKRSSPTSWTRLPRAAVSLAQPSQSPSAMPSSIEMIGYLLTQSSRTAIHSSAVRALPEDFFMTYLPSSKNSLEAQSRPIMMSLPASKPAALMASRMSSMASSWLSHLGAKPPSSPTAVDMPRALMIFLRAWNVSAP